MSAIRKISATILILGLHSVAIAHGPYDLPGHHSPKLQYVGVQSFSAASHVSSQVGSQWTWSAAVEMVLRYHGVQLAGDGLHGQAGRSGADWQRPEWTGRFEALTASLNSWGASPGEERRHVQSQLYWGAPTPEFLISELRSQRPIVVVAAGRGSESRPLVVTAASYIATEQGPEIQSVVAWDPWPSLFDVSNTVNEGTVVLYNTPEIRAHWSLRVY